MANRVCQPASPRLSQVHALTFNRSASGNNQAMRQPVDSVAELVFGRDHHLGRRRRRWRAQVGNEVRHREVGFVTHRGDHRHR